MTKNMISSVSWELVQSQSVRLETGSSEDGITNGNMVTNGVSTIPRSATEEATIAEPHLPALPKTTLRSEPSRPRAGSR